MVLWCGGDTRWCYGVVRWWHKVVLLCGGDGMWCCCVVVLQEDVMVWWPETVCMFELDTK